MGTGHLNRYSFPRCSYAHVLQFALFFCRAPMVLRTHVANSAKLPDVSPPTHPIRSPFHFRLCLLDAHMSSCHRCMLSRHYLFRYLTGATSCQVSLSLSFVQNFRYKIPSITLNRSHCACRVLSTGSCQVRILLDSSNTPFFTHLQNVDNSTSSATTSAIFFLLQRSPSPSTVKFIARICTDVLFSPSLPHCQQGRLDIASALPCS